MDQFYETDFHLIEDKIIISSIFSTPKRKLEVSLPINFKSNCCQRELFRYGSRLTSALIELLSGCRYFPVPCNNKLPTIYRSNEEVKWQTDRLVYSNTL